MSWLPPPTVERREPERPWQPTLLAQVDVTHLRYVSIDEIVLTVGLALSSWPEVDERGRLRFRSKPQLLGADPEVLQRFLREHRLPQELAGRPLRIGDTFAVEILPEALPALTGTDTEFQRLEPVIDPARWMKPPVYDITREARDAAKLSFYAAVTPTLDRDEARSLAPLTDE